MFASRPFLAFGALLMACSAAMMSATAAGVPPTVSTTTPSSFSEPAMNSADMSYDQVVATASGFVALDAAGSVFAFDQSGVARWTRSGLFTQAALDGPGASVHARASADGSRLMVAASLKDYRVSVYLLDSVSGETVWHQERASLVQGFVDPANGNIGQLTMGPSTFAVRNGRTVTIFSLVTGQVVRRVRVPKLNGTDSEVAIDESTGHVVLYNGPRSGRPRPIMRVTVFASSGERVWTKSWQGKPFRGAFEGSSWDSVSPQGWLDLVGDGRIVATFGPWFKRGADGRRAYSVSDGRLMWKSSEVFAHSYYALDAPFSWASVDTPAKGNARKQYAALFDAKGKLHKLYTGCKGDLYGSGSSAPHSIRVGAKWFVGWEHSCLTKSGRAWDRLLVADASSYRIVGSYPLVAGGGSRNAYAGAGLPPVQEQTYDDDDFYLTPLGVVLRTVERGDGEVTTTGIDGLLGQARLSLYPYGASAPAWTLEPKEWSQGATAFTIGPGVLALWRAANGSQPVGLTLYM